MKPVLLAGETFHTTSLTSKGYDPGLSATYSNGALRYIEGLRAEGIEVVQLPGERCEAEFPRSMDQLAAYSAVVLSDIGALSLLLTPESRAGRRSVNRLDLLREWVEQGGGLMMAGGYCSYQGVDGRAMYGGTGVEWCLPVQCINGPDAVEAPEGLDPDVRQADHPIIADLPQPFPFVLGMNRVIPRNQSDVVLSCKRRNGSLPLLVAGGYGHGRSLAWTTDIGPHWLSQDFMAWSGYDRLMANMIRWLCCEI